MTDILGPRAVQHIAMPSAIDEAYVMKYTLRDGSSAAQAVAASAAAIGMANEEIRRRYGNYFYVTDEIYAFSRQAVNSGMTPLAVEYVQPRGRKGAITGWMLAIEKYTDALEWTPEYIARANMNMLAADTLEISEGWFNRFDYEWWTRILLDNEVSVGAGYAPPWAIGTGTNTDLIPTPYLSKTFTSSHSHFNVANHSSVTWASLFDALMEDMLEHGLQSTPDSPFDLFVPDNATDLAEIAALDGFVPLIPGNMTVVSSGADNPRNPFIFTAGVVEGTPGTLIGYFLSELKGVARIFKNNRVPTNYCAIMKGYGFNNPLNPVAIRTDPVTGGFGMTVNPVVTNIANPKLEKVVFEAEFGVNINNRLAGGAGYIYAGATTWSDPTVT